MISETAFNFTAKFSVASCWPKDLETLKVFSLCLHVAAKTSNPAGY